MLLHKQKGLPGMGVDETAQPREKQLLAWLRDRGLTLTEDVAQLMGGVHRTFPGKCLIACTDPISQEQHKRLLGAGFPRHLLPEPTKAREDRRRYTPSVPSGENYCAI